MPQKPKASEIVDWTTRDYVFTPHDGGYRGSLMAWGRRPRVGTLLALRNKPVSSVYRVVDFRPDHIAADYDGFTALVEFVRGSDIEDDR